MATREEEEEGGKGEGGGRSKSVNANMKAFGQELKPRNFEDKCLFKRLYTRAFK